MRAPLRLTLRIAAIAIVSSFVTDVHAGAASPYPESKRSDLRASLGSELTSLRTEDSRTYVSPGGKRQTRFFPEPVNFRRPGDSLWRDLDLGFGSQTPDRYVRVKSAAGEIAAPRTLERPFRLGYGRRTLTFRLNGANTQTARAVSERRVSYDAALPHVDAEYRSTADGLQEFLVLDSAAAQNTFEYDVRTEADLEPRRISPSAVEFVDRAGRVAFYAAAPIAWDSAEDRNFTNAISLELLNAGAGRWKLSVSVSRSWLDAPERVFPVTLDPDYYWVGPSTTRFHGANADGYLSGNTQANYSFTTLNTMQTGYYNRPYNALMRFNVSAAIPSNAQVTAATVMAYQPGSTQRLTANHRLYTVTSDWDSTVTWNSRKAGQAWTSPGGDVSSDPSLRSEATAVNHSGYWYYWQAPLATVQGWVNGSRPNYGFLLKTDAGSPPTTAYVWATTEYDQAYWPAIDVTWAVPAPPTSTVMAGAPDDGSRLLSAADYVDDPATAARATAKWAEDELADVNIDVVTGNLLVRANDGVASAPHWTRYYSSLNANAEAGYGPGWRGSPTDGPKLNELSDGNAEFFDETGARHVFPKRNDGTYAMPTTYRATLGVRSNGALVVSDLDTGSWFEFPAFSVPVSRFRTGQGKPTTVSYASGRWISLTDQAGGSTTATRDPAGRLTRVDKPDGTYIEYSYDSAGRLVSATTPGVGTTNYGYDSSGRLISITRPSATLTTFSYEGTSRRVSTMATQAPGRDTMTMSLSYSATQTIVGQTSQSVGSTPSRTYTIANGRVAAVEYGTGPSVSLSGALWDARDTTVSATAPSTYGASVQAVAASGHQIQAIDTFVNGDLIDQAKQPSNCAPCTTLSGSLSVPAAALSPGINRVDVRAVDERGIVNTRRLWITREPTAAVLPDASPALPPQSLRYEKATELREALGLDATPATVATADASPAAQASKYDFGVPLSPADRQSLLDRNDLASRVGEIDQIVLDQNLEASFGGAWFDQQTGKVVVAFTNNVASGLTAVQALFSAPSALVGQQVTYPLSAIKDARSALASALQQEDSSVAAVHTIEEDINHNRVVAKVATENAGLEASLRSLYGAPIVVQVEPATALASRSTPIQRRMAGLRITSNPSGRNCTLGFAGLGNPVTTSRTDDYGLIGDVLAEYFKLKEWQTPKQAEIVQSWNHYWITAGHCSYNPAQQQFETTTWEQGGQPMARGEALLNDSAPGWHTESDSQLLQPFRRSFWGPMVTFGEEGWFNVVGYRAEGVTRNGEFMCFSGASTAAVHWQDDLPMCGAVNATDVTVRVPMDQSDPLGKQQFIYHANSVNVRCYPGDSGAPVFFADWTAENVYQDGVVAEGQVVGANGKSCRYTNAERIAKAFEFGHGVVDFHFGGFAQIPLDDLAELTGEFPSATGLWVPPIGTRHGLGSPSGSCETPPGANFGFRDQNGRCRGGLAG